MITRAKTDPKTTETIEVECKFCFANQDFKKDWRMWGKPTKRRGQWGLLETWSFHCPRCNAHLNVQWWHRTPTKPLPFDIPDSG